MGIVKIKQCVGEADQTIFGVEAVPKWSHASFIAQSSQFDILINRFGQLQTRLL